MARAHFQSLRRGRPGTSSSIWPSRFSGRRTRSITPFCLAGSKASARTRCSSRSNMRSDRGISRRCHPSKCCGRFNGFIKSVILRISELRDLGDGNRFDFYEHMKVLTAAPPDVLRVMKSTCVNIRCSTSAASSSRPTTRPMASICRRKIAGILSLGLPDGNPILRTPTGIALWKWYEERRIGSCRRLSRQPRYIRLQSEGSATQDGSLLGHCRCQPGAGGQRACRRDRPAGAGDNRGRRRTRDYQAADHHHRQDRAGAPMATSRCG